jgi:hypothetical protein
MKPEKLYRLFHGRAPGEVFEIDDDLIVPDDKLVLLGECVMIAYRVCSPSNKENDTVYHHEFGEESGEMPVLLVGRRGTPLYIVGGNFKVGDWIYD